MSAKYANLPDIDTAQDVYETPDVEPTPESRPGQSSDDEEQAKANGEGPSIEELDPSSLLSAKEARKRFRKAEKRKTRAVYSFTPGSDESSDSDSVPPALRSRNKKSSRFERLLALRQELALLEAEMADPQAAQQEETETSQPKKSKRAGADKDSNDPAEMLKGLHDVRTRLEKMGATKDGRGRLVDAVVANPIVRHTTGSAHTPHSGSFANRPYSPTGGLHSPGLHRREGSLHRREGSFGAGSQGASAPTQTTGEPDPILAKLDSRVGELEKLVGSSSAALDETSPLPPPLLPMLTRLNGQLTILTQPRTIDSISRRLKLLLTDLDRVASQNSSSTVPAQGSGMGHHRGTSTAGSISVPPAASGPGAHGTSSIQDQLTPILQRLAPHLPTLPHILARLRTLSSLHAAAADFQRGMEQLESQQARNRSSLNDLEGAIKSLEKSMQENGDIERNNVQRLEAGVQNLMERLQKLQE